MPCYRLLNNERVKAGGVGQTTRGFTAEEHGQASKRHAFSVHAVSPRRNTKDQTSGRLRRMETVPAHRC